ncbi:VOC family protein [Novosphingobium sp.]|uniref:VOC family protein n=1 Tax=Novosphingobium sp. TaxID=1874826 RepID=UPI00263226BB|nr:VOC family protein [Novosphingobium sp.]
MIAHSLAMVTIVVPDYDAGLAFFVGTLGFDLAEDTDLGAGKRWVVVSIGEGANLLLARAADETQAAAIGRQAGGRVGFFLHTSDLAASEAALRARGVTIEAPVRRESYGAVLVFRDPFGNRWDLIEALVPLEMGKAA